MKKHAGISEHGVMLIIFSIIVVIGIFVILPILGRFLGGGGAERTALVSLESLHQQVLDTYLKATPFHAIRDYDLIIQPNGYIIAAFNVDDTDKVKSGCYEEDISRPFTCLKDNSCLCLYEDNEGQDFDDDFGGKSNPIRCVLLPPDIVFVAPWDDFEKRTKGADPEKGWNMGVSLGAPSIKKTGIKEHENLLLYGQCSSSMWRKGMIWNIQATYIEGCRQGKTVQMFIARESPYTQARVGSVPQNCHS